MFDRLDPLVEPLLVVALLHGHGLLQDHRSVVDLLVDQVHGAAGDLHAPLQGLAYGVRAGERRQQGWMHVDDLVRERPDDLGSEDAHEPRQQDHVGLGGPEPLHDGVVELRAGPERPRVEVHRLDPAPAGPVQGSRRRHVGQDQLDPRPDHGVVEQRLQVRTRSRSQHRRPRLHSRGRYGRRAASVNPARPGWLHWAQPRPSRPWVRSAPLSRDRNRSRLPPASPIRVTDTFWGTPRTSTPSGTESPPGEPRERYPKTDDGWAAAWRRFAQLEPDAVAVGASRSVGAGRAGSPLVVEPAGGLARGLTVLLALTGLANLLQGILFFVSEPVFRLQPGEPVTPVVFQQTPGLQGVGALAALLGLATGIVWLIWQHRTHRNLWAIGVPGLRFTPGWSVGWWFVPFANLVQVPRVVREAWLASEPDASGIEWQAGRTPPLIVTWWLAYIVGPVLAFTVFFAGSINRLEDVEEYARSFQTFQLVFGVTNLVGAALAILVVRNISARHTQRLDRARREPVSARPLAADAPSFTHSGYGHVLGSRKGEYAIWRREEPGEPAERFPATDEGWAQALSRFNDSSRTPPRWFPGARSQPARRPRCRAWRGQP